MLTPKVRALAGDRLCTESAGPLRAGPQHRWKPGRTLRRTTGIRAGPTWDARWLAAFTAVHPHTGGEQVRTTCHTVRYCGSPPRKRGAARRRHGPAHHDRFTPRERGAGRSPGWARCAGRFTPTRAGSRPTRRCPVTTCSVHPHASEEQKSSHLKSAAIDGSPPRERGAARRVPTDDRHRRFTPTRAGSRLVECRCLVLACLGGSLVVTGLPSPFSQDCDVVAEEAAGRVGPG
jgi:hypothetical protein